MQKYMKIFMEPQKRSVDEIELKVMTFIFDIDWQGTKQLSNHKKLELVKIFFSN